MSPRPLPPAAPGTAPPVAPTPAPAVDVTLVDFFLSLTPEERLRENDRMVRAIEELRHGFASAGFDDPALAPRGQRD